MAPSQPNPESQTKAAEAGAAAKPKKTEAKSKAVDVLRVRSMRPSFRRAGVEFGREERVLRVADLTKKQIEALKAEPMLAVVEDVEDA